MTNNQPETTSFLSQYKPPIIHNRLRTTSQLEPNKFCDYVAEVCFIRVENGKAILVLTDYTENQLLPDLIGDGRPSGRASIITTLWDEHCQTAQDLDIKPGDLLYLKNLRPKVDADNKIELIMNGYRPGSRIFQPTHPIQILQPTSPLVKDLRLRKSQYEFHLIAKNQEDMQQGTAPVNEENENSNQNWTTHQPKLRTTIPTQATQTASNKAQVTSVISGDSTLKSPSVLRNGSNSGTSSSLTSLPARINQPPIENIQPAAKNSYSREMSHPVAVKREPSQQPSSSIITSSTTRPRSETTQRSTTPAPMPVEAVKVEGSPTSVLLNKVKQAIRNSNSEGLRYIMLHAKVIGFEPDNIADFSNAYCSKCNFKYPRMSEQKVSHQCPGCNIGGAAKFEYDFQLKMMDKLEQIFIIHVDHEHAMSLVGVTVPAGNLVKNENLLEKLCKRLALIGVSKVLDPREEIYFDCCIRQNIVRDSRQQYAGSNHKRAGGPISYPAAKRLALDNRGTDELGTDDSTSLQLHDTTSPSRLTWSLVFTEITTPAM
ncbi:hypothetical protein FBU30_003337 [Linnemannia zychae]|nr:hypothetical protein FBU30_003337 [Linnemannia zychae]